MKAFYQLFIAIFCWTALVFTPANVKGQCPEPHNNFPKFGPEFNLTPSGIGDTLRSFTTWGGDYHHVQVDSGKTYHISTCETKLWVNPQFTIEGEGIYFSPIITLLEDTLGDQAAFTSASGRFLDAAFRNCPTVTPSPNNDPTGLDRMAEITYTADFTGNLAVILDPAGHFGRPNYGVADCDSFAIDSMIVFVTQIPTNITASISPTDPSCNGGADGSAMAGVTGNIGPVTYLWSTGSTASMIGGLSAGTYSVIITDSVLLSDTAIITLNDPPDLGLSVSPVQLESSAGAADGRIEVTASNGTAPYTYLWSNGGTTSIITGLSAGTYTVTVNDANGCSSIASGKLNVVPSWIYQGGSAYGAGPNPAGLDTIMAFNLGQQRWTRPCVGDLDNDGDLDFIQASREGRLYYYENTGTPTNPQWGRSNAIPTLDTVHVGVGQVSNELMVELADLDADGDLDLLIGSRWNYNTLNFGFKLDDLHYLENQGTATNANFVKIDEGFMGLNFQQCGEFTGPALVDIDADGDLDLLTIGSDSGAYFINIGDSANPNFERQIGSTNLLNELRTTYPGRPHLASAIQFQDFDGDGDLDLYTGDDNGQFGYYENTGTATAPNFNLSVYNLMPGFDTVDVGQFSSLDFGDFNGDGTLDIIAGQLSPAQFSWWAGVSTGPNVNLAATNISCNGLTDGSIVATATGTSPFFYQWSTGDTLTTSGTSAISSLSAGTYTVTVTETGGTTVTDMVTITEPALLVAASIVDANVACNGFSDGGATASATGGTMPYTYAWSNAATTASITGVAAGTYTVSITDANGCGPDTSSVTITEPVALVATTVLDSNDAGGNTGGATASATGGTMPYTYLWSNAATTASITGVAAGTYTVSITDNNGCTDSESIMIAAGPSVNITVDSNVTCNGFLNGGATASVNGGTMPYTYSWNNTAITQSITGVGAGIYSVTVTDANGLTATNSGTITEPAALVAASIVDSNITCNGFLDGGATASATGGTMPYTYAWSNSATTASITGVAAGTYTVSITDNNGCGPATSMVTITEPAALVAAIALDSNDVGNGGGATASATGGTTPYTYAWSNAGTTASITGVAAGTYTVTITDNNGCTDTESQVISANPVPTVVIDSNVSCNSFTDGGATAAVMGGTAPYTYAWSNTAITQSITGVGAGTYTVTVTDMNGLTGTAMGIITQPAILMAASVVDSNVTCNTFSDGGATASATGGTMPYTYAWNNSATTASITGVAEGTYTVSITDANGCGPVTSMVTITQPDEIVFTLLETFDVSCNGFADGGFSYVISGGTPDISGTDTTYGVLSPLGPGVANIRDTVSGIPAGPFFVIVGDNNNCVSDTVRFTISEPTVLITSSMVDSNVTCNGFTDGGATASATGGTAPYTYAWSNAATTASITGITNGTYTVTITDANGCTDTSSETVNVLDTIKPIAIAKNITVTIAANGNINITGQDIDNGSSDACGIDTLILSQSNFNCSDPGANNVVLTVVDVNGNSDTAHAIVNVLDTFGPFITTQNATIYLDANGLASITATEVNAGSFDNCIIQSVSLDSTNFDCSEIGANTVYLRATDNFGNVDSAMATVTVLDTFVPTAIAQNITVYLDANGQASITPSAIDNGSNDLCGITNLSLDSTNFDCSEVGTNTVILTVTDAGSNTDTASATVTVLDTLKPTVLTQNITVYLDANGAASITAMNIDNGSSDNCTIQGVTLDSTNFDCSEIGANTVQLRVTDVNNNIDSAAATVTVMDTLKPIVNTQDITVYLDASGVASITIADIDNGSSDNCSIQMMNLDVTSFSCTEVGTNTVTLTVTDVNANTETATAVVTVLDTIQPAVITQNINLYLDASGAASITTTDIDNGSSDACGALILSLDSTNFDCSEIGANTVQLRATDVNNNIDSSSAIVTVLDTVQPNVLTQDITVYLDGNGIVNIVPSDIDNGSSDACGIQSVNLDSTSFDCSEVGANAVQLIVTDVNGNVDSAAAIVTVLDTIKPTVITQDITVYLDANGSASITTADIDNGSLDNCSIQTMSLDITSFTCSEVGANIVQLIATDVNGNIDSTSAVVTILDTIVPTVITQDVTVYLDANGAASITPSDIDNGSSDNCMVQNISLDISSFDCSNEGSNTVQLRVVDVNNNVDSASAVITVLDTINPMISGCPANINMMADNGNCTAVVTWTVPTAADNCTVDSLVASHNPGDAFSIGTTTVTYIAYDPELNTDTCTFTVTVTDNEDPVIVGLPANITVDNDLDACGAVVNWSTVMVTDNCMLGSDSLLSDFNSGDNFPIGTTTVTYTATDASMNVVTASFTVTVNDTANPVIVCPSDIAQCDSIVDFLDPTVSDNCTGFTTVRTDASGLNSGDQFPVGVTTLSYLVTDASNNQATCAFDIEVYAPTVANAGPDIVTRDIEPVIIEATSVNAVLFNWTPFSTLVDATVEQPIANPQETTVYRMDVTSPDGCTDSDEMQITVNIVNDVEATTLFSPNGDGMNDTWVVNKPALIQGCQLVIVNRNGTEVYTTNNYNNEWDGTINGEQLPEGTYYYVFDCPDGRTMNGPITILRERR